MAIQIAADDLAKLEKLVRDSFSQCETNDGWVNLAAVGLKFRAADPGFDPMNFGFDKLLDLLKALDFVETKKDTTKFPPLAYGRIASNTKIPPRDAVNIGAKLAPPIAERRSISDRSRAGTQKLFSWAHFPKGAEGSSLNVSGMDVAVEKLRGMALPETWEFGGRRDPNDPHPILRNYLRWTFFRLWKECKVSELDEHATFNTGLVDNRYEPIYALFRRNKANPGRQPWYFVDFCIAGEDQAGKTLVRSFNPLPQPAHYFDDPRSMFYDLQAGEPKIDWEHVIVENVTRLPEEFLEDNCPANFNIQSPASLTDAERAKYVKDFAAAIHADTRAYRTLKNRLRDGLELALKRARWNFKTAIPQYYPTRDQMSLLLPLALISDEQPDLALVVERTPSGNYLGHTILPLDWAYNNARLVCRPLSDWLMPEKITSVAVDELDEPEKAIS